MNLNVGLLGLVNFVILAYALTLIGIYLILAILSLWNIRSYILKNAFVDYKYILASPFAPGISLIAPAYNESATIVDNVKSLLSLIYNNVEIIIVNDGSKDNSMEKLIDAFDLVKVNFNVNQELMTKNVRGLYKSTNRAFKKLTVVDKENGGKADALNVGLNVSKKELVACIDVDCVIEPDGLLRLVKPFLENPAEVIAIGAAVRIANSCTIDEGRLVQVHLPERLISRFQVLEYLRSFLLSRVAWSRINGLMLISGAFGLFKRDVAVACGGYNTKTVGEDMELVIRMRAYMVNKGRKHRVVYIPDPLCWTEAPSDYKILGRQRNRWSRGTFEVLKLHRYLLFNPRFGVLGLISYPFWLFFEWLAPFMELGGAIFFIIMLAIGKINWLLASSLSLSIYLVCFFISLLALVSEELSFSKYQKKRDLSKMILTAALEPFWFHPRLVWWAILGHIDLIKGKNTWGVMTRQGFTSGSKKVSNTPI